MKKIFLTASLAFLIASTAGCAHSDRNLRTTLKEDTSALSNLQRELDKMVASKASSGDVYGKLMQAEAHLTEMEKLCRKTEHDSADARSCTFYRELGSKFVARMRLQAANSYLRAGNKGKAEEILRRVVSDSSEAAANAAEGEQARFLLAYLNKWDQFTPGTRAYLAGDYDAALNDLKLRDDPASLYLIGQMYFFGQGVPQDNKQAADWYLKAAEKGSAEAQYRLGVLYLYGDGVEPDSSEAKKWLTKAKDQDYLPARNLLQRTDFR